MFQAYTRSHKSELLETDVLFADQLPFLLPSQQHKNNERLNYKYGINFIKSNALVETVIIEQRYSVICEIK